MVVQLTQEVNLIVLVIILCQSIHNLEEMIW